MALRTRWYTRPFFRSVSFFLEEAAEEDMAVRVSKPVGSAGLGGEEEEEEGGGAEEEGAEEEDTEEAATEEGKDTGGGDVEDRAYFS